jgi:hypothetical protein
MDLTATLSLVKPTHGINVVEGETPTGQPQEAHNLDVIDAAIAALQGVAQGTFLVSAPPTDQTVSGGFKIINTGGFQGPLTGNVTGDSAGTHTGAVVGNVTGNTAGVHTGAVTGDVTGNVTGNLTGNAQESCPAAKTTSAAISEKQGLVRLGGSGACAMTLADPTTVTDDGKRLTLMASTGAAHVITVTGGIGAGTNNTITLGGAIGDMAELEAIAGKWFLRPSINAVASHVDQGF